MITESWREERKLVKESDLETEGEKGGMINRALINVLFIYVRGREE